MQKEISPEIWLEIARELKYQRDVNNLVRTCRELSKLIKPILYKTVHLLMHLDAQTMKLLQTDKQLAASVVEIRINDIHSSRIPRERNRGYLICGMPVSDQDCNALMEVLRNATSFKRFIVASQIFSISNCQSMYTSLCKIFD